MKTKNTLLFWLTIVLFLISFNGHSQFLIQENTNFTSQSLHKYTSILNVKDKNISIKEVLQIPKDKFEPLVFENTDLGFTTDNYWLHFSIKNNKSKAVSYYLETSRPIVDVAHFYKIYPNGKISFQKSGDVIPFKERSFQHRKTIFKINLQPNETGNYYLHLGSDGEVINVPLLLRTTDDLIVNSSFEQIVFGFFYGILIIAFILYFFFFYAMRQKVFLYYSLYVVFIGLLQFSLDGYFYQFITPNSGWLSNKSVLLFAVISGFFLGNYAQYYLNVKQISNRLYTAYNVLYACFGALFFVIVFVPKWFHYGYPAMNALGLFLLILIITSLIEIYSKTKQVYQFFTLGILSLVIGFVIFILKNFGLLPNNFITENSSKLGTGLEIIFLSLSMASLIKKLKEDRENLQNLALQKAEEMNELKTYFLSNISHELRTPLNTIMNFIESIKGETDSNSIQEKCEVIRSSSTSLLSSVNDILDFSKIEKDEIKLELVEFDAHKLFDEIRNNSTILAQGKGLDFQYISSPDLPKMMKGDGERIRQIITNLISNAIKFTSEGFVKFKVESKNVNGKVTLTFIVSDTGEGIAKEKMNSIFDSFSQQTIDNKRKYGGLGLGLYIVKALVNLHKGEIDMQSIVNQGTVCKVQLNVEEVVVKEEVKPVASLEYDLKGKRILVVEDNAMNQMVLKMITKKWLNTEVDYANNGEEGLEFLHNQKYDVILMDLQMPVMDGYEATIAIRSGNSGINDKNIPIIAVTADVMEATKDRVKEIGMNHYLSKPVNKDTLFETIQSCA
ncbi:hybrid sensor histidine kinase/response regulator [Flavobacterium sp.]|uniref:hybrid sensor histidine kinase/response regulator n=1 Tax=Flavobacterium sp. TaxID=239 RepID=UPI002B4B3B31|nr:7TM diverse intracellular signaling domain-containing protein [Flavobacterium sp.]HLP65438.1 7TM diverse intracellular signaling domain-containing protein [Flavobacterium sp.]